MVFDLNPFKPDTFFSTAKNRVSRKMPPLLKFLTAKMTCSWVVTNVSLQAPLKWRPCHLPQEQAIFS
jgi:hypothetical protein